MTTTLILELISAFSLGFISCMKLLDFKAKQQIKKTHQGIEDLFLEVKKDLKKIKFKQRVQNYVHLKSGKYTLVYILDKRELAIFEKDTCIAVSSQINSKTPTQLMNFIETTFNDEIHRKIIQIGSYIVSNNIFGNNVQFEMQYPEDVNDNQHFEVETLDLDTILEKITQSGIKSLTKAEQDYLNNLGK